MKADVLIIGAGIAGVKAAETINEISPNKTILIISDEDRLPYKRTKIDKHLRSGFKKDDFMLKPAQWYQDNNITILFGCMALKINAEFQTAIFRRPDGITVDVSWKSLLLASGASPVPLEFPSKNYYEIRKAVEAEKVSKLIQEYNKITVIGGGVQGMEIVDQVTALNKEIVLIAKSSHLISKQFPLEISNEIEKTLEKKNITVHKNRTVSTIEPTENSQYKITTNKNDFLDTHVIISSIGIKPNTILARKAGIECNNGILINENFKTSLPNIYAAGDVAEFRNGYRSELWHAAENQGVAAGKAICGQPVTWENKPFRLKTEIFGQYFFSLNYQNSKELDSIILEGKSIWQKWYVKNNRAHGVIMKNDKKRAKLYEQAVYENWDVELIKSTLPL